MSKIEEMKLTAVELINNFPDQEVKTFTNTIAHIFKHDDRENFISNWIAFLIDPLCFGSKEPLERLLSVAGCEDALDNVSISREYVFKDGRRIDFYIETDTAIIGIENKIWSDLEDTQLKDYNRSLSDIKDKLYPDKELILLLLYPSRNFQENLKNAIQQGKLYGFKPVCYEELVEEFKLVKLDFFNNLRSAYLMQDFIIHMEEHIMNAKYGIIIDCDMLLFVEKYQNQLQQINNGIKNSKTQIRDYMDSRLRAASNHISNEEDDEWKTSCSDTYYQVYKSNWMNGKPDMAHFELLSVGSHFPPREIRIVLHTNECSSRIKNRTALLMRMQEDARTYLFSKYGTNTFPVDYEHGSEGFEKSMTFIFEKLEELMMKYTAELDSECMKINNVNDV